MAAELEWNKKLSTMMRHGCHQRDWFKDEEIVPGCSLNMEGVCTQSSLIAFKGTEVLTFLSRRRNFKATQRRHSLRKPSWEYSGKSVLISWLWEEMAMVLKSKVYWLWHGGWRKWLVYQILFPSHAILQTTLSPIPLLILHRMPWEIGSRLTFPKSLILLFNPSFLCQCPEILG